MGVVGRQRGGAGRNTAEVRRARTVSSHAPRRTRTCTHEDRGPDHRGGGAPPARHQATGEATLLLYRPHSYGNPPLAQQKADA